MLAIITHTLAHRSATPMMLSSATNAGRSNNVSHSQDQTNFLRWILLRTSVLNTVFFSSWPFLVMAGPVPMLVVMVVPMLVVMAVPVPVLTTREGVCIALRREQNAAAGDIDNGMVIMQPMTERVRYVPAEDDVRQVYVGEEDEKYA